MARLTDTRKRFVIAYVMQGGRNAAQAARWAGISEKGSRKAAWEMLRNGPVLEAIREEADAFFRGSVLRAGQKLDELLESDNPKIQLEAAKELLNRGGMIVATQHNVTVEHIETRSTEELLAIVRKFQADLPMIEDKREAAMPVIEAEFEEIAESVAELREPEQSQTGPEAIA